MYSLINTKIKIRQYLRQYLSSIIIPLIVFGCCGFFAEYSLAFDRPSRFSLAPPRFDLKYLSAEEAGKIEDALGNKVTRHVMFRGVRIGIPRFLADRLAMLRLTESADLSALEYTTHMKFCNRMDLIDKDNNNNRFIICVRRGMLTFVRVGDRLADEHLYYILGPLDSFKGKTVHLRDHADIWYDFEDALDGIPLQADAANRQERVELMVSQLKQQPACPVRPEMVFGGQTVKSPNPYLETRRHRNVRGFFAVVNRDRAKDSVRIMVSDPIQADDRVTIADRNFLLFAVRKGYLVNVATGKQIALADFTSWVGDSPFHQSILKFDNRITRPLIMHPVSLKYRTVAVGNAEDGRLQFGFSCAKDGDLSVVRFDGFLINDRLRSQLPLMIINRSIYERHLQSINKNIGGITEPQINALGLQNGWHRVSRLLIQGGWAHRITHQELQLRADCDLADIEAALQNEFARNASGILPVIKQAHESRIDNDSDITFSHSSFGKKQPSSWLAYHIDGQIKYYYLRGYMTTGQGRKAVYSYKYPDDLVVTYIRWVGPGQAEMDGLCWKNTHTPVRFDAADSAYYNLSRLIAKFQVSRYVSVDPRLFIIKPPVKHSSVLKDVFLARQDNAWGYRLISRSWTREESDLQVLPGEKEAITPLEVQSRYCGRVSFQLDVQDMLSAGNNALGMSL